MASTALTIAAFPPLTYSVEVPAFSINVLCVVLVAALIAVYFSAAAPALYKGFPVVGLEDNYTYKTFEQARERWREHGNRIMEEGMKKHTRAFQVVTSTGPKIVLPGRFADEIRNNPDMQFGSSFISDFFADYPGFEPLCEGVRKDTTVHAVRGKLTQSLNYITEELADETSSAVKHLFGEPKEWTEVVYKPLVLQLVARASSRVFLGPELGSNQEWLDHSINYTLDMFVAADALRKWHVWLRPFVHWFLPECNRLRQDMRRIREIITPIIEKRRTDNRRSAEAGEKVSKTANTIGWLDEAAKGRDYDVVATQVGLSVAALHNTSELISGIINDLCANPQWIEPLREEMMSCVRRHGWTKKALTEMSFTDSLMKESQRHHPGAIGGMERKATKDVQLSDGTVIPKGALTIVEMGMMRDSSVFPDPHGYNPRRFVEMRRQPGQENKWQFVSTSAEHLPFGHGMHSCPGRFFASNEIKIILLYLVGKFDWKFTAEGTKKDTLLGIAPAIDPTAKALIRLRDDDDVNVLM